MASDALMQPESRQGLRRILNLGYTDAIRARYPTGQVYTLWTYGRLLAARRGIPHRSPSVSAQAADRLRAPASTRTIAGGESERFTPRLD